MKFFTKHLIVRYIISGGTSAFVNLSTLSVLYYVFHLYYILASIFSFMLGFVFSLLLQKFWTFKDHRMEDAHKQAAKYLVVCVFGLMINTSILYLCVSGLHFYVLAGQIIAGIFTACVTFFISRDHIFNQNLPL